ncbi:MAG: PTS sugar transporter subunit IIB [Defluviitaleaceae bacterium]|nr:PTS sugar transporter subunit IIB [Defluviitaleaceae bacterium]
MKVLAVCGFGVGSSMILKMSLDSVFDKHGVSAEVDNIDVTTAKSVPCDVIFTSAELKDEIQSSVSVPVYAVKKYMDKEEIDGIVTQFLAERGN